MTATEAIESVRETGQAGMVRALKHVGELLSHARYVS